MNTIRQVLQVAAPTGDRPWAESPAIAFGYVAEARDH